MKNRDEDILLKRDDVKKMLRMKSNNTYYKWVRESGIKPMQVLPGVTLFWKSDVLEYLDNLANSATQKDEENEKLPN